MKKSSSNILSLCLTLALCFSVFTFTPVTVHAAAISINAPGDWPASSVISLKNGDVLTIGSGANSPSIATCIAIDADASVTINGNGNVIDRLYIAEAYTDTKEHTVTINNLKINTLAVLYSTYTQYKGTLDLRGDNEFLCNGSPGYYPLVAGSSGTLHVTSSTGGKLSATSARGIPYDLSLEGNAELTSTTTSGYGAFHANEIFIARNAKLTATSSSTIVGISSSGNLLINNNGTLTVSGGSNYNAFTVSPSKSVAIYMGAGAVTNIMNRDTNAAYDFYMSPAGSGKWRLSNDANFVFLNENNDPAKVSFAKDIMGTITLDPLSNNAYLKALKVSKGKLNKKFSKTRYSYTLKLNKSTATVKFTPTKADPKATVQVKVGSKWNTVTNSYTTPKIKKGKNRTVTFRVTAEDGKTTKTYKIKVSRAK